MKRGLLLHNAFCSSTASKKLFSYVCMRFFTPRFMFFPAVEISSTSILQSLTLGGGSITFTVSSCLNNSLQNQTISGKGFQSTTSSVEPDRRSATDRTEQSESNEKPIRHRWVLQFSWDFFDNNKKKLNITSTIPFILLMPMLMLNIKVKYGSTKWRAMLPSSILDATRCVYRFKFMEAWWPLKQAYSVC